MPFSHGNIEDLYARLAVNEEGEGDDQLFQLALQIDLVQVLLHSISPPLPSLPQMLRIDINPLISISHSLISFVDTLYPFNLMKVALLNRRESNRKLLLENFVKNRTRLINTLSPCSMYLLERCHDTRSNPLTAHKMPQKCFLSRVISDPTSDQIQDIQFKHLVRTNRHLEVEKVLEHCGLELKLWEK
ncbi:hypothetical protein LguiB_008078 [Lonicera macranthoides]